ncbi:MAG: flippase-like domain-containing protein [Balneola sp.]|nr:flippase-like domain-containing protein [Balneola sp.]
MKTALKVIAGILIAGFFLWLAFKEVEFEQIVEASKSMSYGWIIPFVLATLTAHFIRAERWRLLFNDKAKTPHRITLFTGVMVGYLSNIPFARLGEVTRPVYVARQVDESNSKLIGTIVLERIIDMVSLLLLMTFVVIFMVSDPEILSNLFGIDITDSEVLLSFAFSIGKYLGIAVLGFAVIYFILRSLSAKVEFISKGFEKFKVISKTFIDGVLAVKELKNWPLFVLYTALIWVCYIAMTYIPFWMFDMHTIYDLSYADALVLTMVSAVGIIIPTPGGVGTYHLFVTKSLFLLYAVPEAIGLAYGTITHASTLAVIIISTPLLLVLDKYIALKHAAKTEGTSSE